MEYIVEESENYIDSKSIKKVDEISRSNDILHLELPKQGHIYSRCIDGEQRN